MEKSKSFESFGEVNIPNISNNELTAIYKTREWNQLNNYWNINMYITYPNSNETIEMPSVTLTLNKNKFNG
jgi:hypothetical protein